MPEDTNQLPADPMQMLQGMMPEQAGAPEGAEQGGGDAEQSEGLQPADVPQKLEDDVKKITKDMQALEGVAAERLVAAVSATGAEPIAVNPTNLMGQIVKATDTLGNAELQADLATIVEELRNISVPDVSSEPVQDDPQLT